MTNRIAATFLSGLLDARLMEHYGRQRFDERSMWLVPELQAQLSHHHDQTIQQLARLDQCVDFCGAVSDIAYGSARSPIATFEALAEALDSEHGLQTIFFSYAFECFEVAAYRSLIVLCDEAGFPKIRPLLEQSLEEEE